MLVLLALLGPVPDVLREWFQASQCQMSEEDFDLFWQEGAKKKYCAGQFYTQFSSLGAMTTSLYTTQLKSPKVSREHPHPHPHPHTDLPSTPLPSTPFPSSPFICTKEHFHLHVRPRRMRVPWHHPWGEGAQAKGLRSDYDLFGVRRHGYIGSVLLRI